MTGFPLDISQAAGEVVAALTRAVPASNPALGAALERRRRANAELACACGAQAIAPNRDERRKARREGRLLRMTMSHEPDCPATDQAIARLSRAAAS